MHQPQGFVDSRKPTHIFKLFKALYGLKQAPRTWFERLRISLIDLGFTNTKYDTSLFLYKDNNIVILLIIYVDDVLVTSNNSRVVEYFIQKIKNVFSLKDLGLLHHFLGFEVFYDNSGFNLSQTKNILDLFKRFNMLDAASYPTPIVAGKSLSTLEGLPLQDPTSYRSAISALQYLVNTHPDICFSVVNRLSRFLSPLTHSHMQALKGILRYLKGTTHFSLHMKSSKFLNISGFADAD